MNIVRIYMINQMIISSRVFSSWAESGSETVQLAQLLIAHLSGILFRSHRSWGGGVGGGGGQRDSKY